MGSFSSANDFYTNLMQSACTLHNFLSRLWEKFILGKVCVKLHFNHLDYIFHQNSALMHKRIVVAALLLLHIIGL